MKLFNRLFIATLLSIIVVGCGSDEEATATSADNQEINEMSMSDGSTPDESVSDASMGAMQDKAETTKMDMADQMVDVPSFTQKQAAEISSLNRFFDKKFQQIIMRSPQFQSTLGMKDNQDKWDDISDAYQLEGIQIDKQTLNELRAQFNVDLLDEASKLNYSLFESTLLDSIKQEEFLLHSYPVNQMFGEHSSTPSFLINVHQITDVKDAEDYITRVKNLPAKFDALETKLKVRAEQGIILPEFLFATVIDDCKNLLAGYPFENTTEKHPIFADFLSKIEKLEGLDEQKRDKLVSNLEQALITEFKSAYESLVSLLQTLETQADTDEGVWKFPNGKKFYERALELSTTTQMTAEEIHQYGLSEVDRIHAEMNGLLGELRYRKNLQSFFNRLRKSNKYFYKNNDNGREEYLEKVSQFAEDIKAKLPEYFNTLPQAEVVVKRVEAFREKSAGKAFYSRPAIDGSRPGVYYVNLYDMSQMPKYQMEALTYHEGVPGHHMQIALAQELQNVPLFRKFAHYTAYIEGWGLYSEYLGKDMGGYQEPISNFGRLAMELWRACRLVVDTGIHSKKWTRKQGIAYYVDNTPNPKDDAEKMVDRHIVMPGQATSYKIGMKMILELREKAEMALGKKYDIKKFHDTVLNNGAVPLKVLENLVDQQIAAQL